MEFPDLLIDGLWHTTSIQRFKKIVESGLILVYPDIPDAERWCTGGGEEHYPFVRHLEGISLFDFKDFHYRKYNEEQPQSSISAFVPKQKKWDEAVWIEIDRSKVTKNIIDPVCLVQKWKSENKYGHNIMPYVECAHIGDIPMDCIKKTLLFSNGVFQDYTV